MAIEHEVFLRQAIDLAIENVRRQKGGPFGAVIVRDGKVVAAGANQVTASNDPTAHAEMVVIRAACQKLGTFQLDDCLLYTSCEPCPMCLGAIYWAHLKGFYYAGNKDDAARGQFDDSFIYMELNKPIDRRKIPGRRLLAGEGFQPFDEWLKSQSRIQY